MSKETKQKQVSTAQISRLTRKSPGKNFVFLNQEVFGVILVNYYFQLLTLN